jgi:hypothetical protein
MGHALLFPEPAKLKRKGSGSVKVTGLSDGYLAHARTVLAYSRDLALAVRDGTEKLDEAYAKVAAERKTMESYAGVHVRPRALLGFSDPDAALDRLLAYLAYHETLPSPTTCRAARRS